MEQLEIKKTALTANVIRTVVISGCHLSFPEYCGSNEAKRSMFLIHHSHLFQHPLAPKVLIEFSILTLKICPYSVNCQFHVTINPPAAIKKLCILSVYFEILSIHTT